ncbi:hypothetical protein [Pseudoalteromonas arctica]|uniref:Collagen triple helix repeat-containing protein n=1 Tax=Pseudoalteromonas arctica TaxID=394751 RepID=A0A7Y0DPK8_9GAMM|nr:hypothetical protein [Pseudoalteromonas arctica]NMM39289.1 hypothetical protein [Pseudoalteromonas arctica]
MLFTVFSSVVMAQVDMTDLKNPDLEPFGSCGYTNGPNKSDLSLSDCKTYIQSDLKSRNAGNVGAVKSEPTGNDRYTIFVEFRTHWSHDLWFTSFGSFVEDEKVLACPPAAYPLHKLTVPKPTPENPDAFMCGKPLITDDEECQSQIGNDPALNSITLPNSSTAGGKMPKCVDSGTAKCEVTSTIWIDVVSNETHTVWSPVGGSTFTGNACDENGMEVKQPESQGEDKFCNVSNSSGIYQVDCPESSIAINWNTVTGLAQASALDNQRIAAIEASFLKQEDLTALVNSGQLKGDQGEKGDKGEKGIQGVAGAKGATGEKGADGKDGIDGQDGADGATGEKGADGKDGIDGQDGADGATGEKGADGKDGVDGINGVDGQDGADGKDGVDGLAGVDGKDGVNGKDGIDGEDGVGCSVINTPDGASIACESGTAKLENGDSCTTVQLPNGDAQISCEDGTMSEINGVDEDGIISALDTQLTEMKKQTTELEKHTESLKKLSEYDGDKPLIDYETKPDAYTEIAEFDWENNNFGTVMEEHIDAMRGLPLFSAIDNFFVTSFGGSCPVWETTVNVMDANLNIKIDQFCSSAVQNILPYIRAILMLVAGFFAWRIAIE